ncbi:MAG TPA: hypothetical protein VLM41_08985 [Steroidobacteraceae bacterium]|nr:hypothetical protein [Steroidobacteraceae bacterium]
MRHILTTTALALLAACAGESGPWLYAVELRELPSGAGARYPSLATGPAGEVVAGWLEPQGEGYALRFSTWRQHRWQPAGTVASGSDWFINWADFPSVVPLGGDRLAAHWLEQTAGGIYSYDVRVSLSEDGGRSWSRPFSPHDDGTPTEHGFVSLFSWDGRSWAAWLDGRRTGGGHGGGTEHAQADGAMTLRSGPLTAVGGEDVEIDDRVCDCCQTDVAITAEGPVLVYRDRDFAEVRDIALRRGTPQGWSDPVLVHADGWQIDACPVNGPAVDASGSTVVVAWFTAPDLPRVRLAFSEDAGRSFARPLEVASGRVAGRVDVVLTGGRAIVSWLEDGESGTRIRAQPFDRDGPVGQAVDIAESSVARSSGFPQMVAADEGILFAWTEVGDPPAVVTALVTLR